MIACYPEKSPPPPGLSHTPEATGPKLFCIWLFYFMNVFIWKITLDFSIWPVVIPETYTNIETVPDAASLASVVFHFWVGNRGLLETTV